MTTKVASGFTLADLDDWPESSRVELHQGSIVVNPPPIGQHPKLVNATLGWLLRHGVALDRVLWEAGVSDASWEADGFVPDLVVVAEAADVDPKLSWQPADRFVLVVEVQSPGTRDRDLGNKRRCYAGAGLCYVMIDPVGRTVTVDRPLDGLPLDELGAELFPE